MEFTHALFSIVVVAAAPESSEKYDPGKRYALVVLVQAAMDKALSLAREAIAEARWKNPDFQEIKQLPGKITLAKLRRLNHEPGVGAAIRHGQAIIVFPQTP